MNLRVEDFFILLFLGSGVVACLFSAAAISFRKEGNAQANLLLAVLLFITALSVLNTFMALSGILNQFQHLYFIPIIFTFAIGPLFYLFIKTKTKPSFRLSWRDSLHFIPATFQAGFYLTVGFRSAEYKSMIWRTLYGPYLQYIDEIGFLVITLAYLYAGYQLLKNSPRQSWSRPVFHWLKRFIWYTFIFVGIIAVYTLAEYIGWLGYELNIYNVPYIDLPLKLAHAAIALWLGINAWIYSHQSLILEKEAISPLKETDLHLRLREVLDKNQAYLNPDFNLGMLATLTQTSKNQLSAHFSSGGTSFNETTNKYRIAHFLKMAKEHPEYSIESLALDSGFGSKSTFNRAFLKAKGKTPKEYLRDLDTE